MLKDVFDINSFNVYSDDNYYYFFRALEELDLDKMADKTIINSDGTLSKLITDREYYGETKYSKDQEVSLGEMFDHIKMHYDRHTNCISFTSNANCALVYGRQTYDDQYVMMRVPKEELGKVTYQAGLYMLEEIDKKINKIIENHDLDDYEMQKYYFDYINNANSQEDLDRLKEILPNKENNDDIYEEGLTINITESLSYQSLNKEQNFQKNKIIMKLDVLNRSLIPGISNSFLIQTVGNAFASTEIIHYKDVDGKDLTLLPKEMVDLMGLIQQLPPSVPNVEDIKNVILSKSFTTTFEEDINYHDISLDEDNFTIDNMYNITNGNVNYKTARSLYEKAFYLAKAKVRAKNSVKLLKRVLEEDPKYENIYDYLEKKSFGIEPELTTKLTGNFYNLSESISLDLNSQEQGLVDYINELSYEELENIINNPLIVLSDLLSRFTTEEDQLEITKDEWIANAIIDNFDWNSLGVKENLSLFQREDIINKLYENNFIEKYNSLKEKELDIKKISYILFYSIIKDKEVEDYNSIKNSLSLEEVEWFIGYNRIKGTDINLRFYQKSALENINNLFQDKQFCAAILPTGAGKSYVALAEIYERLKNNPNEKILYLAPNVEILNQFKGIIRDIYKPEEHLGDTLDKLIKRTFPNLTFTTYQDLRDLKTDEIKERYSDDYDFMIFDELHRTGATKWQDTVETLTDNQKKKVRILGLTATPKRDSDFKNMVNYWAYKYGYSERDLILGTPMASNMSLVEAIELGIVSSPKVILSMYSYLRDGEFDKLEDDIDSILDIDEKNHNLERLEKIKKEVENSNGIEKIIHDNLKDDGKYIIFLPVNKKENGDYEDEYGNKISNTTAEKVIKDYQLLMKQYIFSYDYLNDNPMINDIYNKIQNKNTLTNEEIEYLNQEKDNLLLLTKIDIINKNTALNTDTNIIADTIIHYMEWEELPTTEKAKQLTKKTKSKVDIYSMLGSYNKKKNSDMLVNFNKDTNGKMKLMFVMNKLNEGVHAKGISGIVWLRRLDEDSLTLYLQQLGRCIKTINPGTELDEKDRPIVLDLVNNTLNMNFDRESKIEIDLRILKETVSWIHNNHDKIPDKNNQNEKVYYNILRYIYFDYIDYLSDASLLNKQDITNVILIKEILKVGSEIDLWNMEFEKREKRNKSEKNNTLLDTFGIIGIERDFYDIMMEVSKYSRKTFDELFDYHFGLLEMLVDQEISPNLSSIDKIRINDKGKLSIVKKKFKNINGIEVQINNEEYFDPGLISSGNWLYVNQNKFTEFQKQKLRNLGYELQDDKYTFDDKFNYHYSLLLKLKEKGISPNISHNVKIRINNDGNLSTVDKKTKKEKGKSILINPEEYHNPELICSGEWLNSNQSKFNEEQKQKLRNIGYVLNEEKTFDNTFDYHFGLLEKLVNQGLSANLSSIDKIKINEDGKLSIVKKKSKRNNGEKIYVNINEYEDTKLIPTGNWLYNNQDKFTEEQKQMLRNVGYILKEDKETFEEKFEYHYSLLERLTTQGLSANLLSDDKIKMDENGLLSIIKPKMKLKNGKAVQVNKEEYFDSSLISSGNWLYVNQSNFTKEQKQKLRQIGYVLKEDILLTDDILKYNSDSLYKLPFDNIFKYHLSILYKLQEQGFSTNLSAQDKIKINNDRSLSLIKIKTEFVDGKQIRINDEEYNDESLITTGNWLYNNQDKFTEEQKQELRNIGYKLNEDKTFDNSFDYYYGLLEKLVNQGLSANITKDTRLRINDDDGTLTIVIRKYKNINKKAVQINKEEYQDKRLVTIGNWLYQNQKNFTEEQKQKLRDIGYVLKEDKVKKLEVQKQKLENLKQNKKGKKIS